MHILVLHGLLLLYIPLVCHGEPFSNSSIFECNRTLTSLVLPTRSSKVVPNLIGCTQPLDASADTLGQQFRRLPIVFVHMPKASGTTVENHLTLWALREYNQTYKGDLVQMTASRTKPTIVAQLTRPHSMDLITRRWGGKGIHHRIPEKLFMGKNSVSAVDELPMESMLLVTVLREPAERILSQFLYSKQHNDYVNMFTIGKRTFEQWYKEFRGRIPDVSNFEVRLLLTQREAPEVFDEVEMSVVFDKDYCRKAKPRGGDCQGFRSSSPLPEVTRPMLERAKRRLAGASLIGLTERFAESMTLWNHTLPGIYMEKAGEKALHRCGNGGSFVCGNAKSQVAHLSHDLLKEIKKDQWASYELYEFAKELFEAQIQAARARGLPLAERKGN